MSRQRYIPTDFLHRLRTGRGLYFLGAGASTGEAPRGDNFLLGPLVDYLRHAHSFSARRPDQPPLSRLLLAAGAHLTAFDINGRTLRPGTDDMTQELLQHMPPNFPRSLMKIQLAGSRYRRRASHNYLPFRYAPSSLFLNYNHDGLADDLLRGIHPVIAVHSSIEPAIGSPDALDFILTAGIDYGVGIGPDNLLMLEPESHSDCELARRLEPMARCRPNFVALIGYSFAWMGGRHNDAVSLDFFVDHYRKFSGDVIVVEPRPERLQEVLAERLHRPVIAVPARWNLLAHAFVAAMAGRLQGRTLDDYCSALIDAGDGEKAFPLAR